MEQRLRRDGSHVLETTVLSVNRAGKARVYDPRRVLVGALTSALTWGVFGLVSGGWPSLLASALLGAAWGGWVARAHLHHLTGAQLKRVGARLPRDSSALLVFTDAAKGNSALSAAETVEPAIPTTASIAEDLSATIGQANPVAAGSSGSADRFSMVVVRYSDVAAAREVAARLATQTKNTKQDAPLDVELVIETDHTGRRRVSDPKLGAAAVMRYNVGSWAVLGVICGALAGLTGGHGFVGALEGGLVTAIAWGLFGAAAGALYGLWAGRAISARRLRAIAPLLPANTSSVVAWTGAPLNETTLSLLAADTDQRRLTLSFIPSELGPTLALS